MRSSKKATKLQKCCFFFNNYTMKLIIKRLSFKHKNKFYILLCRNKHKILDLLGTFIIINKKIVLRINYKKLFKLHKLFKFEINTFNNLLNYDNL